MGFQKEANYPNLQSSGFVQLTSAENVTSFSACDRVDAKQSGCSCATSRSIVSTRAHVSLVIAGPADTPEDVAQCAVSAAADYAGGAAEQQRQIRLAEDGRSIRYVAPRALCFPLQYRLSNADCADCASKARALLDQPCCPAGEGAGLFTAHAGRRQRGTKNKQGERVQHALGTEPCNFFIRTGKKHGGRIRCWEGPGGRSWSCGQEARRSSVPCS